MDIEKEILEYIFKLNKKTIVRDEIQLFPSWSFRKNSLFELSSSNFLEYANDDLANKDIKSTINSLSNIKRALHCQLDGILKVFGLNNIVSNFPSKISLLEDVGIINATILSKINTNRNLLEHEYIIPDKEKVEDFLSAVKLFIYATNKFIEKVIHDIEIESIKKYHVIRISYDNAKKEIRIRHINTVVENNKKAKDKYQFCYIIKYGDDMFKKILHKYIEFADIFI